VVLIIELLMMKGINSETGNQRLKKTGAKGL